MTQNASLHGADIDLFDTAGSVRTAERPQPLILRVLSRLSLLMELWRLRRGPGQLSRDEYFALRLFDNKIYKDVDKRAFVGIGAVRRIWFQANYRIDQFALANNKIASAIWFAAHGLPVLPTLAIFHEAVGRPNTRLLTNDEELRAFLTDNRHYPLFGKPIDANRSVGSASVESYIESHDSLMTTAGHLVSLSDFISFIKAHAATGYQFQSRTGPHASVREICGARLATVRLLTIINGGKPEVLRACWKVPAGENVADNFWRRGNLLAQLDMESGQVLRVIRDNGSGFEEISHHPESGRRILGTSVPNWSEIKKLAQDAAMLIADMPLVGWDIAPVDSGAVIVEANVTPDLQIHQMADRRGVLDPDLERFLQQRKIDAKMYYRACVSAGPSKASIVRECIREAISVLTTNVPS